MTMTLTDRQHQILDWIRFYIDSHGFAPTVREIADGNNISSPNGAMGHIKALAAKGALKWQCRNARTITLTTLTNNGDAEILRQSLDDRVKMVKEISLLRKEKTKLLELLAEAEQFIISRVSGTRLRDNDWIRRVREFMANAEAAPDNDPGAA